MNKKTMYTLIIIVSFIVSFFFINQTIPVLATSSNSKTQNLNAPSSTNTNTWNNIAGTNISYSYGLNTFDAHDSFQVNNSGLSSDSYTQNRVQTLNMDLVNMSSIKVQKYIFSITQTVYVNSSYNVTSTFKMDNNTYPQYVAQLNASTLFNNQLYLVSSVNSSIYGTADTAIITTNNDYLGTFPTNNTLNIARDPYNNVNVTHLVELVGVLVSYTPIKNVPVILNSTYSVSASFFYVNVYNVSYNIHAEQWSAQIRDGDRMGMYVSAFKQLQMNYTETRVTFMSYYIQSSLTVNLTYTNGTYVPFENYPFALRPAYFEQNGTMTNIGIRFINTTSLVASTTAVQAFHAKITKNLQNTQVNASSFVAWMVSSTPRLLAYKDANLDGQLDLSFDPSVGLQQSSGDYIPYVGVLEATSGNAITYQNTTQVYDQHILTLQGFQLINQTDKGVTLSDASFNQFHYGVGNVSATTSFNPYFNAPVNNSGTFEFSFGVGYQNFPVTWVNMSDGSSVTSPMNITYAYVYDINPYTGQTTLSPTITYGAVSPSLKSAFSGLSLATMYESDFLSYQTLSASKTGTTNQKVASSQTTNFASLSFSGPNSQLTSVDTGSKANYTLDGIQHTTNTSVLNLVSLQATSASSNVTVFQSDSQSVTGSAMMQNVTVSQTSLQYRKDLILISYPQWSGGQVIHDPSFSATYSTSYGTPSIVAATADFSATQGSVAVLSWTTYDPDNNGATFKLLDSTGVFRTGTWSSGDVITENINVPLGVSTYTCVITDKDGNTAQKAITVTGIAPPPTSNNSSSTTTTTTTPPVVSSLPSSSSITPAPGFTAEIFLFLAVVGLTVLIRRKRALK